MRVTPEVDAVLAAMGLLFAADHRARRYGHRDAAGWTSYWVGVVHPT